MKFLKLLKYAAIMIVSVIFISCNNAVPVSNQVLSGRNFSLVSPEKNENITITFEDERIYGSGGVNRFFGTFKAENNALALGPLGSTMMAGPEEAMQLEGEILRILSTNNKVTLSGGVLTITSTDGKTLKYQEITKK